MKRPRIYLFIWIALFLEAIGIIWGINVGSFTADQQTYFNVFWFIFPSEVLLTLTILSPIILFLTALILSVVCLIDVTKESNYSEIDLPKIKRLQITFYCSFVGMIGIVLSIVVFFKFLSGA